MIEYFTKKLEILLDAVLEPVWTYVLAASLRVKLAILCVVGAATGIAAYPSAAGHFMHRSLAFIQVAIFRGEQIPLSNSTVSTTRAIAQRLALITAGDLQRLTATSITPWAAAQTATATAGMDRIAIDKAAITQFIRAHTARACACWTELPEQVDEARWVFISGWVMTALAEMKVPASKEELQFVLDNQSEDGAWYSLSGADQAQYKSTYSTAWAVIGLRRQRDVGLSDPAGAQAVDVAISKGAGWLLSHRMPGARWKAYPQSSSSIESESISGLALHALHLADADRVGQLDREWVASLPDRAIPASAAESFYIEIDSPKIRAFDHFVQLKLPWMLVATVDAMPHGDILERSKALHWLETILADPSVQNSDVNTDSWWRAELLYSLRYLLARSS